MDLSWFESILYGAFLGLTDILPVSAQAHRLLLLKLFGIKGEPVLLRLLIHISVLGALYYNCLPQIVKILRAKSLARIPKRRRKRPLDTKSLMDFNLWKTMIIPIILVFFFYEKISALHNKLALTAILLFINGVILYIPQYLPGSNKDSRTLSRVEGLLMGLGGAASVLPGISGIGTAVSVGSVCGVDRSYGLSMALLMNLVTSVGLIVYDIISVASNGIGAISFGVILTYLLAATAAFLGTTLGIKLMRTLASGIGFAVFSYYCWGVSLFTFILNLMA